MLDWPAQAGPLGNTGRQGAVAMACCLMQRLGAEEAKTAHIQLEYTRR